jgi:hypothetical protein
MSKASNKTLAKKSLNPKTPMPWEYSLSFMLAGRCIVTLEKIADGHRNTFLIEQVVDEVMENGKPKKDENGKNVTIRRDRWFVSLLVGSDNNRSYRYLGCVDDKFGVRRFRTTKGTKKNKSASATNINLFGDVLCDLVEGVNKAHQVRIWHHGICGRCCKTLTVPASVATGLGPICAKAMGIKLKNVDPTLIEKLAALSDQ